MKIILIISLAFFLQGSPSCSERIFGAKEVKTPVEKPSLNLYQGKLDELLKAEMSSGSIKFKSTKAPYTVNSNPGSIEARGFAYMPEGAGVSVGGFLANYATVALADAAMADIASKNKGTLTKKFGGQRYITTDGKTLIWSNGSVLCFVTSGPVTDFEEAVAF